MIAEPMTVFTDLLLAAFAGWIAWKLRQPVEPRLISRRLWAWGIGMQGGGALAGGIYHGFLPLMSPEFASGWWFATRVFLGLATTLLVSGIGFAVLPVKAAKGLRIVMALKFVAYGIWCAGQPEFLPALCDQILSVILLIALLLSGGRRMGQSAWPIAGGLAAILVGGLIQFYRLAPHPHFNHNDLYHVFALVSLGCFYFGGRQLADRSIAKNVK